MEILEMPIWPVLQPEPKQFNSMKFSMKLNETSNHEPVVISKSFIVKLMEKM